MTLREIIAQNVGDDVATPEYMGNLGYDDDALDAEMDSPIIDSDGITIWAVPGGYHVSTDTWEGYSEDLEADFPGVMT